MMSLSKAYDLLTILSLIVLTSTASPHIAKRGCSDRCGNVSIPFPFGIGANCALNEWYVINCVNSSTPYLSAAALNQLEVLAVDLVYQTVTVNTPTSISNCRYQPLLNSSSLQMIKSVDLDNSPFLFSGTQNNDSNAVREKINCLGITCCQTRIPKHPSTSYYYNLNEIIPYIPNEIGPYNLTSYTVEFRGLETDDRGAGSCGSAFFVDEDLYVEGRFSNGVVPVSLLWTLTDLDFPRHIFCCHLSDFIQDRVLMANGTDVLLWKCLQTPDLEGNVYLRHGCDVKEECANCQANGGHCDYDSFHNLNFTCEQRHDSSPPSKKLSLGVILGT